MIPLNHPSSPGRSLAVWYLRSFDRHRRLLLRFPVMAPRPPQYWLFKTEPDTFSIDDLAAAPRQTTGWDGVRNYQARNFLRDSIAVGDGVLLYHSNADPLAIVGTARVVKAGYPDPSAGDPHSHYHDPKFDPDKPVWFMVDIRLQTRFATPLERSRLQQVPALRGMLLLQRGSRLSVQPVTPAEWRVILDLAGESRETGR